MGKFDFSISPELIKTLGKLSDIDRVAPKMIDEAIPILERNVKREMSKHRLTGDMISSTKSNKAKVTKNGGFYAAVRPSGVDRKGVRNMEKLAHLEYGTSNIAPIPILTKALKDSKSEVFNKMQEVFNREVGK